jgi:hypothetical protein
MVCSFFAHAESFASGNFQGFIIPELITRWQPIFRIRLYHIAEGQLQPAAAIRVGVEMPRGYLRRRMGSYLL